MRETADWKGESTTMATLLERVAATRDAKNAADEAFRQALCAAKEVHSWAELAAVSGLKPSGVRYLVEQSKGESNGSRDRTARAKRR